MRAPLFGLLASFSCIALTAAAPVWVQQNANEPTTLSDIASRGFTVPLTPGSAGDRTARGLACPS